MKNDFVWERHPQAEKIITNTLSQAEAKSPFLETFCKDLHKKTSTRLMDWVDHISLPENEAFIQLLKKVGFTQEESGKGWVSYRHLGAQLPTLLMCPGKTSLEVALKVDSIEAFLKSQEKKIEIEGSPCSPYRRCRFHKENGIILTVVERRGTRTMDPTTMSQQYLDGYQHAKEKWAKRPRGEGSKEEFDKALELASEIADTLGKDVAAWIVLDVEREYWENRNRVAQIQKKRQDSMGLGWGNHDHHTFRSSRKEFHRLVQLFEILGFHCRERFYAGREAGWGAQVMENPRAGLILFLDVDLSPEEIAVDFAHDTLSEEEDSLGTIGLWCALHGDSILSAGMHHLEGQFDFDHLREDLATQGIEMMDPFSHFTYLKQQFSQGEVWKVDPKRIDALLEKKLITPEQAEKFREHGAVGSHLENLQRHEGYKGFNQKNVSDIIQRTDPRI